jgi:menaquinone-dependent protoporphyrinogen oxidase
MEIKVLVTYATKHGATAEIAEKIGQVLKGAGLQADVLPVTKVKDIKQYSAVIAGSAIYIAMWRKEFLRFLVSNEKVLAGMPVWLFSSGPMGEGDPVELSQGWRFPESQRELIDAIKPREVAVFHGSINPQKMGFLEKWVIKNVKAPTGDFRNWEAITKWAGGIAAELKK